MIHVRPTVPAFFLTAALAVGVTACWLIDQSAPRYAPPDLWAGGVCDDAAEPLCPDPRFTAADAGVRVEVFYDGRCREPVRICDPVRCGNERAVYVFEGAPSAIWLRSAP